MTFIAEKDPGLIPQILSVILDECVNGVTLADPDLDDMPIVYANKAFLTMTGYQLEDIIGKNCRFLQGEDREQEARNVIRQAVSGHESVVVTLRNYRKSGELFYNRLKITPLFDSHGEVIYYLGVQYDVTRLVQAEEEIKALNERLAK
ncbi:MAG: PAS domain-containing protein [Methylococcales bacterium]|nr:PAS domain-containing protein [Methylococcales bacterium]